MMKNQKLKIFGENIFLRYVRIKDMFEFIELNRSSVEFYKGLTNPLLDAESFKLYVDRNLDEANECFIICRKDDNKIVGSVNLSQIFRKAFQNTYLGYSLGVQFTGNGYMTEAVGLILHHAFENLNLHRVEANVQPHNLASVKVLERCGFSKEGFSRKYLKIDDVWCDHERWAIIIEDWKV